MLRWLLSSRGVAALSHGCASHAGVTASGTRALSSAAPATRSVAQIKEMTANKAFAYVFTRTLPLRSQPELAGESAVACAVSDIDAAATRIMDTHIHRVADDRAAVHLHAAALAVATHRVLLARLRDDARVFDIVRGAFGAGRDAGEDARLPGHWFGKAALVFSPDRMEAIRRMTQNAANDFGSAFSITRADDRDRAGHKMVVSSCLYADICRAEGVPALTRIFCHLDRALFSHVTPSAHGVSFEMSPRTLADSPEDQCEFVFRKQR